MNELRELRDSRGKRLSVEYYEARCDNRASKAIVVELVDTQR